MSGTLARLLSIGRFGASEGGRTIPWKLYQRINAGYACRHYVTDTQADPALLARVRRKSPFIGAIAGLFGSLVGVGGGVVITPMIVNICKSIPQRVVTGTSLAAVLSTALTSGSVYSRGNCVDYPSALLLGGAAIISAPIGARLTMKLDCARLRQILGIFLLSAAPLVPMKALFLSRSEKEGDERLHSIATFSDVLSSLMSMPIHTVLQMGTIGITAGLFSGLLGIGGGTIVTPMLAMTTELKHAEVLGTALVCMVPPSMAAVLEHYRLGNVDLKLSLGLVIGTAVGGYLGSHFAVDLAPPGTLEAAFFLGMLFLGLKTLGKI